MAREISIDLLSNVQEAVAGLNDVADSVDNVGASFRDLTGGDVDDAIAAIRRFEDAAAKGGRVSEAAFEDAVRGVVTLGRRIGRSGDDIELALQGIGLSADDAADALAAINRETEDLGRSKGPKDAAAGIDDVATSADNAKKKTSDIGSATKTSGDGFRSLGDIARSVLNGDLAGGADSAAESLTGLGPVGAAAGLAIAAGLGAALTALSDQQKRINDVRESAKNLASTLYQNRGRVPIGDQIESLFDLLASERNARGLESVINGFVDLGTNIDSLKRAATVSRLPVADLYRTLAGSDTKRAREILVDINAQLAELYKVRQQESSVLLPDIQPLETTRDLLQDVIRAGEIADATLSAVGSSYQSESYRKKVDDIAAAWDNARNIAADYFDETDTRIITFDFTPYVVRLESTVRASERYKTELIGLPDPVRAEAERIFNEQGVISAVKFIDGFTSASPKLQQKATAALAELGKISGEEFAQATDNAARAKAQALGPIPVQATLRLDDSAIRNYRPPVINFRGEIRTANGRQIF